MTRDRGWFSFGGRRMRSTLRQDAVEAHVEQAETVAARMSTEQQPRGRLGTRFDWRAPFLIAVLATLGVAVTYGAIRLVLLAGSALVLIFLAFFLAVGMEPLVQWVIRRGAPRWVGVIVVLLLILGVLGGFLAAAIPAMVSQGEQLIKDIPALTAKINDHSSWLGRLNERFHFSSKISSLFSSGNSSVFQGVLGAGKALFSALTDSLIVLVLTIYFLADFPRVRTFGYRFVFASRRPRAILIGDEILSKVGYYVLGNLLISLIAGLLTFIWLVIFEVPYPLLLSILVALLDLIPAVGATVGGLIVALVALTVSLPVAIATAIYFVIYRLAEDYLLVPRIIGRAVHVPGLVTVLAALIGAVLMGVLGALVAIPIAAALLLILREVVFPRFDQL